MFIQRDTYESGVTTGEAWSAFSWHHSSVFHCQWTHNYVFLLLSHMIEMHNVYSFTWLNNVCFHFKVWIWFCSVNRVDWWNNRLLLVTNCYVVVTMVATSGPCGCAIEMSHTEINKVVSHSPLAFNLCIPVTWPLTCAFHTHCTHTPEIIDMHRDVCDKQRKMMKYL